MANPEVQQQKLCKIFAVLKLTVCLIPCKTGFGEGVCYHSECETRKNQEYCQKELTDCSGKKMAKQIAKNNSDCRGSDCELLRGTEDSEKLN